MLSSLGKLTSVAVLPCPTEFSLKGLLRPAWNAWEVRKQMEGQSRGQVLGAGQMWGRETQ